MESTSHQHLFRDEDHSSPNKSGLFNRAASLPNALLDSNPIPRILYPPLRHDQSFIPSRMLVLLQPSVSRLERVFSPAFFSRMLVVIKFLSVHYMFPSPSLALQTFILVAALLLSPRPSAADSLRHRDRFHTPRSAGRNLKEGRWPEWTVVLGLLVHFGTLGVVWWGNHG